MNKIIIKIIVKVDNKIMILVLGKVGRPTIPFLGVAIYDLCYLMAAQKKNTYHDGSLDPRIRTILFQMEYFRILFFNR